MPMPPGIDTVTLTGRYVHPDGSPFAGKVTFSTPALLTLSGADTIAAGSATVTLDAAGQFTVILVATDNANMQPTDWAYRVTEQLTGVDPRVYSILLPSANSPVDLADIAPADPALGNYVPVPGPAGAAGNTILSGHGTPPSGTGRDGDYWMDLDAWELYGPKASGAWAGTGLPITDVITSVNGQTGIVELGAADVGADTAGAASTAVSTHAAATDPHGDRAYADNKLAKASNLSDLASAATARTNLGLGTAATQPASAFDAGGAATAAQTAATTAAATSAAALYLPSAVQTVDAYFTGASTSSPRFFAHRGGGMVRPEHTMAGYRASAAQGFPLEVSVNVDASGELWCIHDTTMDRTTYRTGNVNSYTTEEIGQQVLTNGRVMLGPGWTDQPMVPLRQVLDEFLGKTIIFLEPKGNDAVVPTQTLLDTYYPHAPRSVIWKAHIGTASLPWAKSTGRNYRTWVYMDSGTTDATLDGKDSMVDYWGVQTTFTDTRIQQIVARGKPVFSWPVYRRSQVTRLTGFGVVGIMASDPRYVSTALPQRTASRWDLQVKESGGTPTLDYDSTYALAFAPTPDVGWVSINALPNQSYGLGTYAPIQGSAAGYRISFDMKYKVLPADLTFHGGIYFGKASDDAYRFSTANATGGYHVVMRANGQLQLNRHDPGVTTGTTLATAPATTAVVADNPMSFQVDVTPTTLELRRTDGTGWTTGPITNPTYRGGYLGLSNGSITDLATRPYWRNLVITQL